MLWDSFCPAIGTGLVLLNISVEQYGGAEWIILLWPYTRNNLSISPAIQIIASQNRLISASDSDSVGSIINVPGTGKDIVGALKPKINQTFCDILVTNAAFFGQRTNINNTFAATLPNLPAYKTGK